MLEIDKRNPKKPSSWQSADLILITSMSMNSKEVANEPGTGPGCVADIRLRFMKDHYGKVE